jgi:hypothetical protein
MEIACREAIAQAKESPESKGRSVFMLRPPEEN